MPCHGGALELFVRVCAELSKRALCLGGEGGVTSTQPSRDKKQRAAGLRGKEKCNSAACS